MEIDNLIVQFLSTTFVITRLLIYSYALWYLRDPENIISVHVHRM